MSRKKKKNGNKAVEKETKQIFKIINNWREWKEVIKTYVSDEATN